jgi:predicted ATPase/class 3 adenylate cyclase
MTEPRSAPRELPSGNVTFLFTDIEGSTRMFHHLGDAFVGVVEDHRAIVRGALADHGGVEVSTEGDGFFIAFADAAAAVAACLAIQQALAAHAWPDYGEVRVRMGLHTGIARPTNGDYLAIAVHQAARIAATTHGGQIIVSSDTSRLVDRVLPADCSLADRGLFVLKDFDEPARLFQLLHPTLPAAFAPLRAPPAQSRSLPDVGTTFVGREGDVKNIVDLLDEIRLLSIVGPGGAGKTRLALEIGARLATKFEAGTQLCDLSPITDPALVGRTIASAFAIRNTPDSDSLEAVARTMAGGDVLFVLDNCEHVIDATASAVESLLSQTRRLRILATSREPLSIPGEQVWRIMPLDIPEVDDAPDVVGATESGHLFEERARRVLPGFAITVQNAPAVVSICRQLEGLPLALELAAAQVAVMDPSAIADRLSGRLQKLGSGSRRGMDRHRTLEATIDWSYQLLDDDERRLLNALSVCAGGFTVEAVETICATDDAVELLTDLVQKSLVIWDPDSGRYRLLETIRQYAADRLAGDESEHERARDAHVYCYYRLACTAESALTAAHQGKWLEALSHDHDNLRRAIAHLTTQPDDAERALRMLTALYRYWLIRANLAEWIALIRPLLEHTGTEIPAPVRGRGLMAAALVSIYEDTSLARQLGETALEIARRMDDDTLRADAMSILAAISHFQGDHDPAVGEQALTLSRRIGNPRHDERGEYQRRPGRPRRPGPGLHRSSLSERLCPQPAGERSGPSLLPPLGPAHLLTGGDREDRESFPSRGRRLCPEEQRPYPASEEARPQPLG